MCWGGGGGGGVRKGVYAGKPVDIAGVNETKSRIILFFLFLERGRDGRARGVVGRRAEQLFHI